MTTTQVTFIFNQKELSRESIRKKVVDLFMEEKHGPAENETYRRYTYLVEKTKEGNILLIRPANLKLGFDFRIDVEGMSFRKGTASPTHIDLFEDLKKKHNEDPFFAEKVREAIVAVNNMEDPEDILLRINEKNIGFSVELILKISKWFAVEQDIRYWNGWGRMKQVLWLNLMKYFEYRFEPGESGFSFFDKSGKLLNEKTAINIMNNSQQKLH